MPRFVLLAVAAWLSWGAAAYGQVTTYFGDDDPRDSFTNSFAARNAFFAALTARSTNDIESIPPFTPLPSLAFPGIGRTATTTCTFVAPNATLAVSGTQLLLGNLGDFSNPLPNLSDVFTFDSPISGFGMFFTEVGDLSNQTTLAFHLQNSVLNTDHLANIGTFGPGRANDAVFFFGATDTTPFDRVVLTKSTASDNIDGILFDDVTAGFAAVPEPGTICLLAAAAASVMGAKLVRRRGQTPGAAWRKQ